MTTRIAIPVEWWSGQDGDLDGPTRADLEVERDDVDPGRIAIHTMKDGPGSQGSYYLDREAAIRFAHAILDAVILR